MFRNQKRPSRNRLQQIEPLENRVLLAGDLVAQWVADSLNASTEDGAAVPAWVDSVSGIAGQATGNPVLVKDQIGGRSTLRFDNTDGADGIVVPEIHGPVGGLDDFSIAVVFATNSQNLVGDQGDWYSNSGLVDGNTLGFGKDWGVGINQQGQLAAGMSGGFFGVKKTFYSDVEGLNDNELHVGVLTRSGANLSLYSDGALVGAINDADVGPRTTTPLAIGVTATGNVGFDGDIAEVRVFNGQLTANEVTNLQAELMAYYDNTRPNAVDDTYTMPEDPGFFDTLIPMDRGVLANDTDAESDPLRAILVEDVKHGRLSLSETGAFSYTPNDNYFGTDTFTYTANDFRASEPATVSLVVTPVYDPPEAVSEVYKVLTGSALTVSAENGLLANDLNPDEADLKAVISTPVQNGSLTLNQDGSFQYDPQNFFGRTSFQYQIDDGTGLSAPAEVTLIVNTAPSAADDQFALNEDQPLNLSAAVGIARNDSDVENDDLTFTLIDEPTNGALQFMESGEFRYLPAEDYFGSDSFSYSISDGEDVSNVATVSLVINPVNDAPRPANDVYFGLSGETLSVSVAEGLLANDIDIDSESITARLVSQPNSGQVTLQENGSFEYMPVEGFTGVASFTYRASDGAAESDPISVEIAINSLEQQKSIVINEVHVDPPDKTEWVEFIELHNTGTVPIDVSGWTLRSAVDFTFPAGSSLAAGEYLVATQDPDMFKDKFDTTGIGPWSGKLRNSGEQIELWTAAGHEIDTVDYQLGFPWPTYGEEPGPSIQLINPQLENDLGGSWTIGTPTPNAKNTNFADNAAPQMRRVEHSPNEPTADVPVTITALVTDPDGVQSVSLDYQLVNPGDYISISDARYDQGWVTLAMRDDGSEGDEAADDGVYSVVLPKELQTHRRLVRYRVTATDTLGASVTGPYADDPTPNFAYFVYNGVPDWTGAARPGQTPEVNYPSETLSTIPVYHLITTHESHVDSQYIPDSSLRSGYTGSEYRWEGSMVYDGKVYDHIRFRARGGVWRYAMGKNMWKFDFNRGQSFEARDNRGVKYDVPWDRLNFSAIIQQGNFLHRGEQGLFESVGFKLFNLAGTESPNTNYAHYRLITGESETGNDQYSGDFQGMYLSIQQPDGRFLEEHDLPDGNFYKIEGNNPESTTNQGPTQVSNRSDGRDFIRAFTRGNPEVEWWRENLDLERYYGYQAISEAIHHYDTAFGKNFFYYNNPETGKFQIHPWDLDLTWADNMFGNANHEFNVKVAKNRDFNDSYELQANIDSRNRLNHEYQNRVREIMDLLYNPEQTGMLIDEMASFVYTPGEPSLVDADRAMWDYNPINATRTKYSNNDKNATRHKFYDRADTKDYQGMIQILKDYVESRSSWMNRTILRNEDNIPTTPVISYSGEANFPVNGLEFKSDAYGSPIDAPFAGMMWRIAEVTDPSDENLQPYDSSWIRKYEIESVWESDEITEFNDSITIPGHALEPGKTYRVRMKTRDSDNHWSHWSEPVQFTAGQATANVLVDAIRVSEVNYNPAAPSNSELAAGFDNNNDFEFVEIVNISDQPVDLAGLSFNRVDVEGDTQGIDFAFSDGQITTLDAGVRAVVVENLEAFVARYGDAVPVAGEWSGRLGNNSETITLQAFGTTIQQFAYADEWYPATDGEGATLAIVNPADANLDNWNKKESWQAEANGGSPGSSDQFVEIPGDANRDGTFNSSDLVQVFAAGEYEDGIAANSTWEEGDWNNDSEFDTADLVAAFQFGAYVLNATSRLPLAAALNHDSIMPESDEPPTRKVVEVTVPVRAAQLDHAAIEAVFHQDNDSNTDDSEPLEDWAV